MVSRTSTVLLLLSVLLAPACIVRLGDDWGAGTSWLGKEIAAVDGGYRVNGVELTFDRWVTVDQAFVAGADVDVGVPLGDVVVDGAKGESAALEVQLWSEVEGDGVVAFEDGVLTVSSAGEHEVMVGEVRGTLPSFVDLRVHSGLGSVTARGFENEGHVKAEAGMGAVQLERIVTAALTVDAGMGKVVLEGGRARDLTLEAGMGSVHVAGFDAPEASIDAGMGSVTVAGGTFASVTVEAGMGSVRVESCTITDTLAVDAGMGNVDLVGGSIREVDNDLGMGNLNLEGGVQIGS